MVKNNYFAWHVQKDLFKESWSDAEKLRFFAKYGVLAPSGHNVQPWAFRLSGSTLCLLINKARGLPVSGKVASEPYVSIGSCIQTIVAAALGFGYELDVEYIFNKEEVAKLKIVGKSKDNHALLDAITTRSSNRSHYKQTALENSTIEEITDLSLPGVKINNFSKREDIDYIAEKTSEATKRIMTDKKFRNELSTWVRNNLTNRYDGMPGFTQGMPTPISLIAPIVIKNVDISSSQAKKDSDLVRHSSNVLLISSVDKAKEHLVSSGRLYSHVCIMATSMGYATSGVGAAAIDKKTNKDIQDHFGIGYIPIAAIRIGETDKTVKHTPRWPAEELFVK